MTSQDADQMEAKSKLLADGPCVYFIDINIVLQLIIYHLFSIYVKMFHLLNAFNQYFTYMKYTTIFKALLETSVHMHP